MTRLLLMLALGACTPAKRFALECAQLTEERAVVRMVPLWPRGPFRFLVWCRAPRGP